jgi:hypothetical protein
MKLQDISFGTTDWSKIEPTEHRGEHGIASWRTQNFGDIRVRMVEYSAGYLADHWCRKGHILLVQDGQLDTELWPMDGASHSPPACLIRSPTTPNRIGLRPKLGRHCLSSTEPPPQPTFVF